MKMLRRESQRRQRVKFLCTSLCLLCASLCSFFSCNQASDIPQNIEEANELVWIEGGKYQMGDENTPDAYPLIAQEIQGFWMHKYEVTNAQFNEFVNATHYITLAEKNGGSYVFVENGVEDSLSIPGAPWWRYRQAASWRNPRGDKNIKGIHDFSPVTHIAYEDACAYCDWLEMRLPTEAEWEFAAQQNGEVPDKNIWQGNFPYENKNSDGFIYTSPVGSFPAGKKGLHDINGNVWEWCSDYYHANWYVMANQLPFNERYKGPKKPYDPSAPYDSARVIRGGSFLCAENYCTGYLPFTRMRSQTDMTFGHIGFRCVKR